MCIHFFIFYFYFSNARICLDVCSIVSAHLHLISDGVYHLQQRCHLLEDASMLSSILVCRIYLIYWFCFDDYLLVIKLYFVIATVGRRSSVLKMKPTPPPPEMTSMKRPRSSRVCASKRKVLMDDTMVLHGEYVLFCMIVTSFTFTYLQSVLLYVCLHCKLCCI